MTDSHQDAPVPIELKPTSEPLPAEERAAQLASPGFGRVFTEHMVMLRWTAGRGWHDAQLRPYGAIELDPATMALHYGQIIFEGLKAYRQADGGIAAFRPYENARRFQRSARRLAMPELPEQLFVSALETLVRQDRDWVPSEPGHSLYLRPYMFATEIGLGVNNPSSEYLCIVIASPAASYFPRGVKPVSVWLSEDYTRAAPGGTGEVKCAGNYAAGFLAQAQAVENGCDQIVWLDAAERRWVEEMGGMNLFFVYGEGAGARLVTPSLTGTLLPGVTRDSLLTLGPELGFPAGEGRITVDEWRQANLDGSISEVFACGTAAVITPVGSVRGATQSWTIGDGEPGVVTTRLREALLDIQYGTGADPHSWRHRLC
ncbi:MAG: branched-chain amino acid aminotransferase [Streptomycetales bacterium]